LELGSGSAYLWYNIGSALRDLGAFSDAAEACRRALALEPDFAEARSSLGDALFALGQPDEAAANYACALRVRETPESIAGFVRSFVAAELRCVDGDVRAIAIRAIRHLVRPAARNGVHQVVANGRRSAASTARGRRPSRSPAGSFRDIDRDAVYGDLLLPRSSAPLRCPVDGFLPR
jgi:tetratricopeptide (TPR) repeat protein